MRKLLGWGLLVVVVLGVGGWFLFSRYEIRGWDKIQFVTKGQDDTPVDGYPEALAPVERNTIRIATFNIGPLDDRKMLRAGVVGNLAAVIRQFDIVAIQDVQSRDHSVMVTFLEQVNATGGYYAYLIPPAVGRDLVSQYSAFLYNRSTILADPSTVYTVIDPGRQFRRPPLVASFRTRGPDPAEAFTFTLVNVHTDSARAADELDVLCDVCREIREDGRNEDDVLVLGDLGVVDRRFGALSRLPHVTAAITLDSPAAGGMKLPDNLLFNRQATIEYTGRSGVTDLMRQFNLTAAQASEMSDHLPVWAEFSVYEGGRPAN